MIELLEARIAPAILFSYNDADGDKVTVAISKGTAADATITGGPAMLLDIDLHGNQVFKGANITVTAKPQDVNHVIEGDGLALVDAIAASGVDLGTVTIHGDLHTLFAGDASAPTVPLAKLSAISIGAYHPGGTISVAGKLGALTVTSNLMGNVVAEQIGPVTIGGSFGPYVIQATKATLSGDIASVNIGGDLRGDVLAGGKLTTVSVGGALVGSTDHGSIVAVELGTVTIKRDVIGGGHDVSGGSDVATGTITSTGKIGSVTIGGALLGSAFDSSARIAAGTDLGSVKVGLDLRAGTGARTALVSATGTLGSVTVGGSVIAGGQFSAQIFANKMGTVKVGGDVRGGTLGHSFSGRIFASAGITSITVGGSLIGGDNGPSTGGIESGGTIGSVVVGGDIVGGNTVSNTTVQDTGYILAQRLPKVTIGGSIYAGSIPGGSGSLEGSGSIQATDDLGTLTVGGSLVGSAGPNGRHVVIAARGQPNLATTAKTDLAIGKVTVTGSITYTDILAGYGNVFGQLGPSNADAQVGTVTVGGDWVSSNLIAGVQVAAGGAYNGGTTTFGNAGDTKIAGANVKDNGDTTPGAISRIAAVIIKGNAIGTLPTADAAFFGIEAQQLGSITIAGTLVPLRPLAHDDPYFLRHPLGSTTGSDGTGDFRAFEVA